MVIQKLSREKHWSEKFTVKLTFIQGDWNTVHLWNQWWLGFGLRATSDHGFKSHDGSLSPLRWLPGNFRPWRSLTDTKLFFIRPKSTQSSIFNTDWSIFYLRQYLKILFPITHNTHVCQNFARNIINVNIVIKWLLMKQYFFSQEVVQMKNCNHYWMFMSHTEEDLCNYKPD